MISEEVKYRLSFLDYKSLIDFVKTKYKFDLSNFAYSITKRRSEDFLAQYNVSDYNEVLAILGKEKIFIHYLEAILVPTTEMFRDFEFWLKLKIKLIPKLKIKNELKIWIPDITTDDELLSLLIVLKEAGIDNNFEIIATTPFDKIFEKIESLSFDDKRFAVSKANYETFNPKKDFESYFVNINNHFKIKKDILINVKFKKYTFWEDYMQESYFDIVLFRNRMIYYNQQGQRIALNKIFNALKPKGFLFLGLKEQFGDWMNKDRFSKYEKDCNIFIRKK